MTTDTTTRLGPEETRRLIDFARACKAAARAVVLYPSTHPTIGATLGRIAGLTSATSLSSPLRIAVLADSLLLEGLPPGRSDAAVNELAVLLHNHLIGELTVHPGGDIESWRQFLVLVGRTPDDVRNNGGIAQVWNQMEARHIELREIDYAEVLRERDATGSASWADIVAHCLSGESRVPSEESRHHLVKAAESLESLENLVATLDSAAVSAGRDEPARATALVRLLDRLAIAVTETSPEQSGPLMSHLATALTQLSAEMLLAVLAEPAESTETPGLIRSVLGQIPDHSMARFVARHVMAEASSTERLAQVFQTLVPDDQRDRLLALAKTEASSAVAASGTPGFEAQWQTLAQTLLTSYSDKLFVSEQYGRELSRTRETAIDVEQVSDDPPERMAEWLGTVSPSEQRKLDLALVRDLLRLATDKAQWSALMRPVVALIDDLMLVGDFEAADGLVGVLTREQRAGATHHEAATGALDALVAGPMMRQVAGHLATIEDAPFECVKGVFLALGESMIPVLAETLLEESHPRTRERLTVMFMAFGASGRREVERFKSSGNAAVRRTAVDLLRQFGGSEALTELNGFLNDIDPQIQREAVRAILSIGSDAGYAMVGRALTEGTPAQREAIATAVNALRDDWCAPLFTYILRHVDHRGPLLDLYLRAIKALGALKDPAAIDPLREALHRGEWWAPRRTTALRDASAAALARIGTRDAVGVLEEAVASGSRGVRAAARAHLNTAAEGARDGGGR